MPSPEERSAKSKDSSAQVESPARPEFTMPADGLETAADVNRLIDYGLGLALDLPPGPQKISLLFNGINRKQKLAEFVRRNSGVNGQPVRNMVMIGQKDPAKN